MLKVIVAASFATFVAAQILFSLGAD